MFSDRCIRSLLFRYAIWAAIVLVSTASKISAGVLTVPVVAHSVSADVDSLTTLRVDMGDMSSLLGKRILYARLSIGIDFDTCGLALNEISIQPFGGSKSASSRTNPWNGEPDSVATGRMRWTHAGAAQEGLLSFGMTELVQAFADGQIGIDGFLIQPHWKSCAYRLSVVSTSAEGRVGELLVKYLEANR